MNHTKSNIKDLLELSFEGLSTEDILSSSIQGLIAAEISMRRQILNISQKEFAEKMGVSQGLVSRWETGETNFTISTLAKIAVALDLKMQSPIIPTPCKSYAVGYSNIYRFSTSESWDVKSTALEEYVSTKTDELEEM